MHERTQRAVARLLFALLCALPTLLTFVAVVVSFTPWYVNYRRHEWERELSRRIGLSVEIESLEHPAPATVRLGGVRLLEPETQREVARVHTVTWVTTADKSALRLSQPELQSAMLPYTWRMIHERFLCQPDLTDLPMRMAADDLTIHSSTGPLTLRDVDAWLRPAPGRVEATFQGVPASRDDQSAFHISVVRNRNSKGPTTDWTMKSGDLPLACSALADYLPVLKALGPEATFQGMMKWQVDDRGWAIDLGGSRFDFVDLGTAMQDVPHRLTGLATIKLDRCQFEPGTSLDLSGTLTAGAGFVSQSLMQSLADQLSFQVAPMIPGDQRDWPYETLALRFDLFGSQMTLAGICHQQRGCEQLPEGIVFAGGRRGLAACATTTRSWVGLMMAIWPDQAERLPISTQNAWLLPLLPAPPPTLSVEDADSPPRPRITDARGRQDGPGIGQPE